MATKQFPFIEGEPDRVTVRVGFGHRSAKIELDGVLVGEITNDKAFKAGQTFVLSDGSHLSVVRRTGFLKSGIDVLHNQRILPGSASTPAHTVEQGGNAALFVGVLSVAVALFVIIGDVQVLQELGFGWFSLIEGAVFLGLGALMRWKHSFVAAILAAGLWVLEVLSGFYFAFEAGVSPAQGIIVRGIILALLIKAVPAARRLKDESRAQQQGPPQQNASLV